MVATARALARSGAPHMLIGGLAVIARGFARTTRDIDYTVVGEGLDLDALLECLAGDGITPRIEDPVESARHSQVPLLRHEPSGTPLDVKTLVRLHHHTIDLDRVRDLVAQFAEVLEVPERVDELERVIARALGEA